VADLKPTTDLLAEFSDAQLDAEHKRRIEDRRARVDQLHAALRLPYTPTHGEWTVHEYVSQFYGAHEAAQVLWCLTAGRDGYPPGSFYEALINTALKADRNNIVRLSWGFPKTIAAVWDYKCGLGEKALRDAVRGEATDTEEAKP